MGHYNDKEFRYLFEVEEEPILTIHLRCSCTDYRNAMEVWKRNYRMPGETFTKNYIIVYMISLLLIPIDMLLHSVKSEYKIIGIVLITLCSILTKDMYTYICVILNKRESIYMDNIENEMILEKPEEPILILNLKCNSNDYRYSKEMWSEQNGKLVMKRIIKSSVNIICLTIFFVWLCSLFGFKYSAANDIIAFILTIAIVSVIKNLYFAICCMRKQSYFVHLAIRSQIRSFALVYENRTIKEIKKILIPCKYRFYDTYLIKTIPLPETMYKTSAEKIVDLPLTIDNPIEYSSIEEIYENKKCITFFQRVFFLRISSVKMNCSN